MHNFSPNMLKTFQTCPKKYQFMYEDNLSVPQKFSLFEKGKKVHALANYYLQGYDVSKMETVLSADEKKAWEMLKSNEYFGKEYVKSEYSLSCKVGNYWVGGRLDAIVKDDKNLYILDYKTGSIPKNPEYDYQTMVYLLCLNNFIKKSGNNFSINFVYIDLKNNENCIIRFDKEKRVQYEEEIIKICQAISNCKFNKILRTKSCECA